MHPILTQSGSFGTRHASNLFEIEQKWQFKVVVSSGRKEYCWIDFVFIEERTESIYLSIFRESRKISGLRHVAERGKTANPEKDKKKTCARWESNPRHPLEGGNWGKRTSLALAGNRTRGIRLEGGNFTTKLQAPDDIPP